MENTKNATLNKQYKYNQYVKKKSPKPKFLKNSIWAFFVGGFICTIGQFISNTLKNMDLPKDDVSTATAIILIFLGAFLTGLGVYDKIGKRAGGGSIVPITGFANSIVSPAMEFKREGYIFGVGAKMFILAGPVLVYGFTSSVIVGLIYFFLDK
ncbi:stage V sporulation protein AC [Crassaminicella profunda]|uniref:stage V sporulation protein AC n=1 Tax=Crassaminicella profunda TaxID=1286698 RepID=UPI001CA628AE|nr:stage V sporulation protein AC [Crassaminicella profunda]QZY56366.1 stage V sporulation protein AC [Crassaminicella profunda]